MIEKKNIEEISKAAVEITEIMNHAPLEIRLKYPYKYRKYFKNIIATDYIWKYDTTKKLYEQNISELTKEILKYLNENFFKKGNK